MDVRSDASVYGWRLYGFMDGCVGRCVVVV